MKRTARTRRFPRKAKRQTQKQRQRREQSGGADKNILIIVLFSSEPPSSETLSTLRALLKETFNSEVGSHSLGFEYKFLFLGPTGLRSPLAEDSFETSFLIETPPAYLTKQIHTETLLTALEHELGNALLSSSLSKDISMIPVPHGLVQEGEEPVFMIGLCSPPCYKRYKKNAYKAMIQSVL
jgi:hypothetical protein